MSQAVSKTLQTRYGPPAIPWLSADAGNRLRELGAGSFVGLVGQGGRPLPPAGLTVQLATRSRVLVIDAERLAVLIDSDPAAAAAWRKMSQQS